MAGFKWFVTMLNESRRPSPRIPSGNVKVKERDVEGSSQSMSFADKATSVVPTNGLVPGPVVQLAEVH